MIQMKFKIINNAEYSEYIVGRTLLPISIMFNYQLYSNLCGRDI